MATPASRKNDPKTIFGRGRYDGANSADITTVALVGTAR